MITTCPVITFPVVIPTEEINVIAIDVAIVVRIGNFKITSIIGTKRNEPPAPIMPDAPPTIKANKLANHLLYFNSSPLFRFGTNIIIAAIVANAA